MAFRDLFAVCLLVASCTDGDEPASSSGLRDGTGTGVAGEAGAAGVKGEKGDKGDSVTAQVKEVFGNKSAGLGLPMTGAITTTGGRLLLTVSGSGYRVVTGGTIGFDVSIDGTPIGSLNGFANEIGSHKAVAARTLVIEGLIAGNHTLAITAQPDTVTDANDYFNLTALELSK